MIALLDCVVLGAIGFFLAGPFGILCGLLVAVALAAGRGGRRELRAARKQIKAMQDERDGRSTWTLPPQ